MSAPANIASYAGTMEILDKALESPKGISIGFPVKGAALKFRQNAYTLRSRLRARNREIYKQGDPGWNSCVYDTLSLSAPFLHGETWKITVEPVTCVTARFDIEEL